MKLVLLALLILNLVSLQTHAQHELVEYDRLPWSTEEDAALLQAVAWCADTTELDLAKLWIEIAATMKSILPECDRNAEKCYYRWAQCINPALTREPLADFEKQIIADFVSERQTRVIHWTKVAEEVNRARKLNKCIGIRSTNKLKNYWNMQSGKRKRNSDVDARDLEAKKSNTTPPPKRFKSEDIATTTVKSPQRKDDEQRKYLSSVLKKKYLAKYDIGSP